MSDLTTLELFRILDDRALLDKLHAIQRERCDELAITGGTRPTGMRLSTPDPVRRAKAALDPFWALTLDEGVGSRGHALEAFLEVALFHDEYAPLSGKQYASQVAIQWHEHGRSAFDFVVHDHAGGDRVVSCKSSIKGGKPTSANVAQERRMMALAGHPAGSVFEIWVVDPSTFRAVGPHEYGLGDDDVIDAQDELARVSKAYDHFAAMDDPTTSPWWNDPASWLEQFGLESSSGAFRYESIDASGAIESRLRPVMHRRQKKKDDTALLDADEDRLKQLAKEQILARQAAGEQVKSVTAYGWDERVVFTLRKDGVIVITTKPFETADAAA